MPRRNYRLASPWMERHGLPQQPATCQIKLIWVIWQAKLLADSVHLHHIPTDSISVCNSHAAVLMRTIISRKINFVCKILKIFPSTYKSHVMNQGARGWISQLPTSRSKSKRQTKLSQRWYANLPLVARAKFYHYTFIAPPPPCLPGTHALRSLGTRKAIFQCQSHPWNLTHLKQSQKLNKQIPTPTGRPSYLVHCWVGETTALAACLPNRHRAGQAQEALKPPRGISQREKALGGNGSRATYPVDRFLAQLAYPPIEENSQPDDPPG